MRMRRKVGVFFLLMGMRRNLTAIEDCEADAGDTCETTQRRTIPDVSDCLFARRTSQSLFARAHGDALFSLLNYEPCQISQAPSKTFVRADIFIRFNSTRTPRFNEDL